MADGGDGGVLVGKSREGAAECCDGHREREGRSRVVDGPAEVIEQTEVVAVLADDAVGVQLVGVRERRVRLVQARELERDRSRTMIRPLIRLTRSTRCALATRTGCATCRPTSTPTPTWLSRPLRSSRGASASTPPAPTLIRGKSSPSGTSCAASRPSSKTAHDGAGDSQGRLRHGAARDGRNPFSTDSQLRLLAVALRAKLAREGLPADRYSLRPEPDQHLDNGLALPARHADHRKRVSRAKV